MKTKRFYRILPLLLVMVLMMQSTQVRAAASKTFSYENAQSSSANTASSYTGMKKINGKWMYVVSGKVDTSYTGLVKYNSKWVYVIKGELNTTYTGLVKYKTNWVYVNKGKLDASYTGLVRYKTNWVYVNKGKLDPSYTGMVKYKSTWVYVNKGKLNAKYTGLARNKYGWWHMTAGKLDLTYTGMSKNKYGWWYTENGKLDLTYTGISENKYGMWYMTNGKLDLTYTGEAEYKGNIYEVVDGKVTKNITLKYDIERKLEETEKEVERLEKVLYEEASTQYEMNQISYEISLEWNELLDYIWATLEKTVDANIVAELEKEQNTWLSYREKEIELAESDYEGGSMAIMAGYSTNSKLTKERIYELLEYFSEKNNEPVKLTIEVWVPEEDHNGDEESWIEERCEAFSKAHPEWDITFDIKTCMEGNVYGEIKKTAVDGQATVAVYAYANDQLESLVENEWITSYGWKSVAEIKSANIDNVIGTVTADGKIYGVPYALNTWFMYYDKSVYTEDDIKNLDIMMEKKTVGFPFINSWYSGSFFLGNGCKLYNMSTEEGFDFAGDKAIDVANYLIDIVNSGNIIEIDLDGGVELLKKGVIGASFSGCWHEDSIRKILGENMGATALPTYTLNGQEKQMYSFLGSKAYGINPQSEAYKKCPEAVEAFALFLGNGDSQLSHYKERRIAPTNIELHDNPLIIVDEVAMAQIETAKNTSVVQPYCEEFNLTYWYSITQFFSDLCYGYITKDNVEEYIEKLNDALNDI